MTIKEWPEDDRPREKLLNKGAAVLSDAELLAIFLRVGIKANRPLIWRAIFCAGLVPCKGSSARMKRIFARCRESAGRSSCNSKRYWK